MIGSLVMIDSTLDGQAIEPRPFCLPIILEILIQTEKY